MKHDKKTNTRLLIALFVIAIVFNPIIQIYIYKTSLWLPLLSTAILVFILYAIKKYRDLQ
jgi:hypothetical protein